MHLAWLLCCLSQFTNNLHTKTIICYASDNKSEDIVPARADIYIHAAPPPTRDLVIITIIALLGRRTYLRLSKRREPLVLTADKVGAYLRLSSMQALSICMFPVRV